ncbi:MAG: hypothetical protein FJY56_04460 [Betaproteobacteria bacterium]|nr:hypothetical protein [Betaproteobacteria bacterium]
MKICKYLILLYIFWVGLIACSLGPEKRDAPALFDLGPQRAHSANPHVIAATVLIAAVNASAWLDTTGMQYRLAYQDASRPETYAQHRWVATPAQLLTERVRARFAAASRGVVTLQDGAKADVTLRIELEDFSQSFDSAQSSKATMRLRATLVTPDTRALLSQRTFNVERPAAPSASGAAQALASASDALIEELYAWATQQIKK